MLRACSGAVFIVSPEADGGPNHNVLIEFGLVAGRMGRPNVALCKSGGVSLPSDLLAVTVVELDGAPLASSLGEPGQMLIRFETDFEEWSSGKGRARKET
jgi:Predicted nucleotide-binding protein containing TIR-like domain